MLLKNPQQRLQYNQLERIISKLQLCRDSTSIIIPLYISITD